MFSIFTLGHFFASTRRRATLRATLNRVTRVTVLLGILCAPSLSHADDQVPAPASYKGLSKWPVNQADPVSSVPTPEQRDSNPLEFGYFIMDLADLAGMAVKREDFAAASKLYEATVKADPGVAVGYRNVCLYSEKSGNLERALVFCRTALGVQGVLASDYVRYADLVFSEPTPITKDQIDDLQSISEPSQRWVPLGGFMAFRRSATTGVISGFAGSASARSRVRAAVCASARCAGFPSGI